MTEITLEFVNILAPEHGRSSCSDDSLMNSGASVEETFVDGKVVARKWSHAPRCMRCFLLNRIGEKLPDYMSLNVCVSITLHGNAEVKSVTRGV